MSRKLAKGGATTGSSKLMLTVEDAEHIVMLISIARRIVFRAGLVSGGGCRDCRSVVSDAADAIRVARLETPWLRALFRDAGRQFFSAGRLFHADLRDICLWRALTPACHGDRRPIGPEMATAF